MTRLPEVRPQELARALERAGFVFDRGRGSHRIYKHEGRGVRVVIPFHPHPIRKGTLHQILKDAGLTREDLLELL
jgi:predicted RNA binding protein YcfA (HicA-like mRNA interferase family)